MSLVTLLLFWKFCHCNIFLSISITRPKITISYLLKPLCVWNSKISSEKDRVMLIHHIYFSHMPMAKFCHIPFCQGKESGLRPEPSLWQRNNAFRWSTFGNEFYGQDYHRLYRSICYIYYCNIIRCMCSVKFAIFCENNIWQRERVLIMPRNELLDGTNCKFSNVFHTQNAVWPI